MGTAASGVPSAKARAVPAEVNPGPRRQHLVSIDRDCSMPVATPGIHAINQQNLPILNETALGRSIIRVTVGSCL